MEKPKRVSGLKQDLNASREEGAQRVWNPDGLWKKAATLRRSGWKTQVNVPR